MEANLQYIYIGMLTLRIVQTITVTGQGCKE